MNAAAIRILFDYNAWANAKVWACAGQMDENQFVQDTGYSLCSVRNHLVHIASVDARWFARLRGNRIPRVLDPEDFPTREDVSRLWSVVYDDLGLVLQHLPDALVEEDVTYTDGYGTERTQPGWQILLHVVNHGTDHRAQLFYALHRMGITTPEQDFVYYLRDELPPRGYVTVDVDMIRALFDYDAYATSRLVSESIADLSDGALDRDFGYSHGTIRAQLAHLLVSGQYWLERTFQTQIEGNASAILGAANDLLADLPSKDLMRPVEYTTGSGLETANMRWEMLWHLVNHGTDHRAQTLAMLHELDAPTFAQDLMQYFWDVEL
jgi:uncharacterized damage-inducible protein DinB